MPSTMDNQQATASDIITGPAANAMREHQEEQQAKDSKRE